MKAVEKVTDSNEPITAEWLEASGAVKPFQTDWYWFYDDASTVTLRPIGNGVAWMVCVNSRMMYWSATTRGQIDRLRQALKGEV